MFLAKAMKDEEEMRADLNWQRRELNALRRRIKHLRRLQQEESTRLVG